MSSKEVAKHFFHNFILQYGPPVDLIAANGKQITANYFQGVCWTSNVHKVYITTNYRQRNVQVERYNHTIFAVLRTYIMDHPKDWDVYTDALTYAYNCQPKPYTAAAPFVLVLLRPPRSLATQAEYSELQSPNYLKYKWKLGIQQSFDTTRNKLLKFQARYKRNYDNLLRRGRAIIKPDDYVFFSRIE